MALKFKNEAINKQKSKFTKSKTGKYKPIFTSFNFDRNTKYKGLCLREYINGEKHFVVRFRLRGNRKKLIVFPVGKFDPTQDVISGEFKFGTKECEARLFPIVKSHCDELGRWIKNPNDTVKFNKVITSKNIGEVIEAYCKKGFPKINKEEKLVGRAIREKGRILIGYNQRVKFLEYEDDELGDGFVKFKYSRKYNEPAPKDWDELFKRYPSGKGILKDEYFNRNGVTSIYDSNLCKIKIEDLTGQMVIRYRENFGSYYIRYDIKENFRRLWKFAINQGYIDVNVKPDPTRDIVDLKPRKKPYKYRLKIFSDEHFDLLLTIAEELSPRFPFQAEAIILMALTGLRKEECLKLLKSDLKWDHKITKTKDGKIVETFGKIYLRSAITKMDRDEDIDITEPIKNTLKNILDMGNRTPQNGYQYDLSYYKRLPWVFGTTELRVEKLFDEKYTNSRKTRLKTTTGCWTAIKKEMRKRLSIPEDEEYLCSSKMLRKTHTHKCKKALDGRSDIAKRHTRHKDESILEGDYDGSTPQENRESAVKIAQILPMIKLRA